MVIYRYKAYGLEIKMPKASYLPMKEGGMLRSAIGACTKIIRSKVNSTSQPPVMNKIDKTLISALSITVSALVVLQAYGVYSDVSNSLLLVDKEIISLRDRIEALNASGDQGAGNVKEAKEVYSAIKRDGLVRAAFEKNATPYEFQQYLKVLQKLNDNGDIDQSLLEYKKQVYYDNRAPEGPTLDGAELVTVGVSGDYLDV